MKKVLLAFVFLIIAVFANSIVNSNNSIPIFNLLGLMPQVTVDSMRFSVSVAKTPQDQEKGLSGRESLAKNSGMLFVFSHPDIYTFWMKGMKFPLDMIFIRDNKIVEIFPNVKPSDNPQDVEKPTVTADKVLEINAGLSQTYGFKVGDAVAITNFQ